MNLSNGLIKPMQELVKLVTKPNSKVHKLKIYNKAINNPINRNRWPKAIDEEFWILNSHQTWCYITLSPNHKLIGCKWVFKIKYHPNKFIKRYKARIIAQSFLQMYCIDYTEIFTLTIR